MPDTDDLDRYIAAALEARDKPTEPDDSDDDRPKRLLAAARALLAMSSK